MRERLRLALEAAGASAWEWNIGAGKVAWSAEQYDLFGADPARVTPSFEGFLGFVHPEDRARVAAYIGETVATRRDRHEQEFRVIRTDGQVRHLLSRARLELNPEGQPVRLIGIDIDITEHKHLEDVLRQSEERFRMVLSHSPVVVFAQDRDLRYTWLHNSRLGFQLNEVVGKTDADLYADTQAEELETVKRRVMATGIAERVEVNVSRGSLNLVCDLYLEPLREGGRIVGITGAGTDITERKRLERKIERLAMYDPLTDLPNRTMFLRELDAALARAQRTNGAVVVMLIDLDGFKQVNDTYGHAAGDQLLREVAGRLHRCVREGDLVGRLGGDEFALVVEGSEKTSDVVALADRIIADLGASTVLQEGEITFGASVGITVYPDDLSQRDELLAHADRALYAAKAAGGGCWAAFATSPGAVRECIAAL